MSIINNLKLYMAEHPESAEILMKKRKKNK